ncbi:hypothetical protein A2803_00050 [Candidatus Woesebacteria bacterium RIFCSPHIGHO2_01_FULL_44_21]|uniref:Uncharacterized protein n=1 Tax=Candidatus Woesebacteria bacterium RIFCSPHIGHO2_01_FULL_44_21 TaxID=1802503 RepID=A0A1F7Z0X6_9BACT|nr:MAG: hypothetical protein A2803_00050 [Candidatus Woesebacteria bacterium RIFCSPHIGHO2_01_FULL_44_21]OGM71145.1 MAG: hypothetical protein A2897_02905 [Candidatus Woesebacteria bacterium RIFCSPLOWO2_01_FULL_44_24b]
MGRKIEFDTSRPSYDIYRPEVFAQIIKATHLPDVDSLEKLVGKNNTGLSTLLESQRRYAAIFHIIPGLDQMDDFQTEIRLSSRCEIPISDISIWYGIKEKIKFEFYPWAQHASKGDVDSYDLALKKMEDFIDLRWNGSVSGLLYRALRYQKLLPKIIANEQRYNRFTAFPEGMERMMQKNIFEDDENEEESINTSLGFSKNSYRSIFEGIPLNYIPNIIASLPNQLYIDISLWRLGYQNTDLSEEGLCNQIHPLAQNLTVGQKIEFVRDHAKKAKKYLIKAISLQDYGGYPTFDFVDLTGRIVKPLPYFYKSGIMINTGGIREKILLIRNELNERNPKFKALTKRQREVLQLLSETDGRGTLVYTNKQVAAVWGINEAVIQICAQTALKRLNTN